MSVLGQSRHFDRSQLTSGLPSETDVLARSACLKRAITGCKRSLAPTKIQGSFSKRLWIFLRRIVSYILKYTTLVVAGEMTLMSF
jgi:hypothetical protein